MSSTTSSSQILLPLQSSYPIALYILCPILITYFGIYVMLRNHYIFRPRFQIFLKRTHVKSIVLKQIITDLLSSFSILTFVFSSIILSSTDQAISLMLHNDLYWSGLCMSILVYRNIKQQQPLEIKVVIKNAIFLLLSYTIIAYQYFTSFSLIMMSLVLMAIYITNLIFKVYQQKFVNLIQVLFNSKPLQINSIPYNHINKMQSPEYLSINFPVNKQQLQEKLSLYQPNLKRLKLKTKIAVTKKLLTLSLAIKISQQKMINKMKRDVSAYYGGLNGTTNQKVKRLEFQIKNSLPADQTILRQGTNQVTEQDVILNILQVDDQLQVLFTIFPIRLFESSTIISIIFTLLLNLSFGICLDYVLQVTSTLKYGSYLNNLYALLILPVLPSISKTEYFNSMTLSSLWKYFLIGLFITISVVVNGLTTMNMSKILQIKVISVGVMIIFVIGYLLTQSKSEYKLFIMFFLLFAANLGLSYSQGSSHNTS